nr:hypothetical protein [Vibrio sp. 10N.286.48.B7]
MQKIIHRELEHVTSSLSEMNVEQLLYQNTVFSNADEIADFILDYKEKCLVQIIDSETYPNPYWLAVVYICDVAYNTATIKGCFLSPELHDRKAFSFALYVCALRLIAVIEDGVEKMNHKYLLSFIEGVMLDDQKEAIENSYGPKLTLKMNALVDKTFASQI